MTKTEKYLKDGVKEEFIKEINEGLDLAGSQFNIVHFLNEEVKPTLTEDEKVILRNLHYEKGCYEYERIGRTRKDSEGYSDLYLIEKDLTITNFNEYLHLFQFIKERRRIFY